MAGSRIDQLIQSETAPAVYVHLTLERLDGTTMGAYMLNAMILWFPLVPLDEDGALPDGARSLYVQEGGDRA